MQKKSKNAKKKQKCKKKAENARSISKFMQKKSRNAKKRQKMHFNLKIHAKKDKNRKKKAHLFGFCLLLYPLCILNLKIHIKKDKNAKKKQKKFFKLQKYICKKKA